MRRITILIAAVLAVFAMLPLDDVLAQSEAPWIVATTIPVDAGIRSAVEAWIGGEAAPVQMTYWAITYVQPRGEDTLVSILALDLITPDEEWRVTDDDKVAWMGTVLVMADSSVEMYSRDPDAQSNSVPKLAMPSLPAPGGGSYVRFPWQAGGSMMYGPRGVHAAGGGGEYATGFLAVDFVGGDDMGSGVAPPRVYSVTAGTVDYVCADSNSTLIRTENTTTNDYYIYAHMLDNANLEIDHEFSAGAYIGNLKYGSFNDTCGWAEQADNHYHLHFGFQAASNSMRMENCILNTSTQKWTCGTQVISTGQFLRGGGGVSGAGDSGGLSISQPSFWDYVVAGVITIWDRTVVQNMPSHTAMQYTHVIYASAKLAIKMAFVLVRSNVNLGPLIAVMMVGLGIKALFALAEFIVFLFKAWKSLVPILGA